MQTLSAPRLDLDMIRKQAPAVSNDVEVTSSKVHASTQSPIASPVVINDEDSVANTGVLEFYLRGIFSDEVSFNLAFSLLQHSQNLTLREIEERLEHLLLDCAQESKSATGFDMCKAFYAHKAFTSMNRIAYLPTGRVNPNAVFWPDPTDPSSGRSLYSELPLARTIPLVDRSTRIVSAGSCFATEIAHSLQSAGYNYLVKESNKGRPGSFESLDAGNLPNSSAAWGIIFNTPSFRQLVEKAFEIRALPKILWTQEIGGKLRYLDPFRENIAFESPEAFEENYQEHIEAARAAFLEMEVFIITLGLNEVWYFKADGAVFSRSPWRTAPSLVSHRVLSVEENVYDLVRMREILKAHNPNVKIICTLSPVPLHATFRGSHEHIVTANAHSKAVLRVAAGEFERRCPDVYYFPSYEVVTTSTELPWAADQRHVSPGAVTNVMALFHKMFGK
jgi:hypothetical protein